MKFLFASLIFFASLLPGMAQTNNQKNSDKDKYTIELVKTYKNRSFYILNLSELNENKRAGFIDNLYKSQNIIVTSRLDSEFNLKISAQNNLPMSEIKDEINQIISLINSNPSSIPTKF